VRRLVFGLDTSFEKNLGYMAAAFSTTDYEPRDEGVYVCYSSPGKQIARYALSESRTVFFLIFAADESSPSTAYDDKEYTVRKLEKVFGNEGWESERMLQAMRSCNDLYFDRVSQIRMPSWSEGRVALVGDAAFCPSLLAGQGAALAMAGSYILAGELKESNGDYKTAFERYEEKLKPFIAEKQKGAENFASWFAPKTALGILVRNQITKLFSIPVFAHRFVSASIADRLRLCDY
jgi:2-polyprenyl-6-methoxyphenol hydroxylase-like FAD-dependent oxidoreductase